MSGYIKNVVSKTAPHVGQINPTTVKKWTPILGLWGGAALFGVFTFTEHWPLFQQTFFQKIPYFGDYWVHTLDPEDSPQ
ncbi:unnamed protein product [Kuraishia capsulata CBS 1993]|uniref:Cytochrome b-c1 complex subunit 10 n=1 Tax=Kuraishia capsulata CBS 1993 TaxID=1382522 RepID=W6MJS9_9ASCO|nr:uncharacterized protein KUCA_T00000748001 [Kuraishia capsulata CBS 1993]CDK24782.1 unnamed protein product [Kuraishia capsulata CBS 1993]